MTGPLPAAEPSGLVSSALGRLGRHAAIYALGPAVQKAIGFLLLPLVTLYVGGRGNYGVTEMSAVTIAIASQVLGINLLHGMTRYHPEYSGREQARLVSTTLLLLLASTGTGLVLALGFSGQGAELFFGSPAYAPALVATAAILVAQTIGQVGLRWLQIHERSVTYGVVTTLKMLCEVGLKVWFLVGLGLAYMGVLYSVLCGELLIAAGCGFVIARRLGLSFSWPIARRLLSYSWPLFFAGLCMFALHQVDRFFLLRWHGEAEVGLYAVGYKLGAVGNTVIFEAFALIWFPFVFGLRDTEAFAALSRRVLSYFTAILCGVFLVLAVFRREIVGTMTAPEFAEAHQLLPWIAAGYLFWGIFQIVHTAFYLRERTGLVSLLVAGGAALNLVLCALLVPRWGYAGAAWATTSTFAALALAAWILAERVMPVRYEIGRVATAVGLALLIHLGVEAWAELFGPAGLLARGLAVLAFPAILGFGGYLHPSEHEKIRAMCRIFLRASRR